VLDEHSGQPISFAQSFKRNSILLLGQIPVLGGLAGLVVILIIAVQVAKGYRLGDRFARTRVIWKKYARLPVFGGDGLICETCGYDLHGHITANIQGMRIPPKSLTITCLIPPQLPQPQRHAMPINV
jgi:hypothetical protein